MPNHLEFLVGQQYENRKGVYTVLEVQGSAMRIRWEDGEEVETTVIMQSRIIGSMKREFEQCNRGKVAAPLRKNIATNGWRRV